MRDKAINTQIIEKMFLLSRLMKEGITFKGKVANLTLLQLQALTYIKSRKEVAMSDLAAMFAISLPTATVLSDKLIKEGFVKRVRSTKDRRVVNLVLKEGGKELLQTGLKQRNAKLEQMLSFLTQAKKEQLLEILSALLASIQTNNETT